MFLISCFLISSSLLAEAEDKTSEKKEVSHTVTDWDARLEYARLLSNLKRYDESLIQYKKLLSEKPDSVGVQSEIAHVMYYQGKIEEALNLLEQLPSDKVDSKSQILKGDIYEELKDYTKAEGIYREQLVENPKDDLIRLKLAEMLSWQKKYTESIELYQQILALHPDDIHVRRKYGLVLMWMGKDSEAAEELEKTLK